MATIDWLKLFEDYVYPTAKTVGDKVGDVWSRGYTSMQEALKPQTPVEDALTKRLQEFMPKPPQITYTPGAVPNPAKADYELRMERAKREAPLRDPLASGLADVASFSPIGGLAILAAQAAAGGTEALRGIVAGMAETPSNFAAPKGSSLVKRTRRVPGYRSPTFDKGLPVIIPSIEGGPAPALFGETWHPTVPIWEEVRRGRDVPGFSRFFPSFESPLQNAFLTEGIQPNRPTYHSNVLSAFENPKIPSKLTQEQALAILKSPGVKGEELKWLGLEEKLRSKPRWGKEEITKFIEENQIDVEEIRSGGPTGAMEQAAPGEFMPRWDREDLRLPGGERYREVLLTWGNKPKATEPMGRVRLPNGRIQEVYGDPNYVDIYAQQFGGTVLENTRVPVSVESPQNSDYNAGHYSDIPNVLAHIRLTDRLTPDGKKVLFVEEVQSDWQKDLRHKAKSETDITQTWNYKASQLLHEKGMADYAPFKDLTNLPIKEERAVNKHIPDAPLVHDYPNLTMKRIIRLAAEEGYDAIGWTTGKQQANRYSQLLINNIGKIEYNFSREELVAYQPGRDVPVQGTPRHASVSELPALIGREAAEAVIKNAAPPTLNPEQALLKKEAERKLKVLKQEAEAAARAARDATAAAWDAEAAAAWDATAEAAAWDAADEANHSYQSALHDYNTRYSPTSTIQTSNLQIGKTGYVDLYDTQLNKVANQLGGKFGTRTQKGQINIGASQHNINALTAYDLINARGSLGVPVFLGREKDLMFQVIDKMNSESIGPQTAVNRLRGVTETERERLKELIRYVAGRSARYEDIHLLPIPNSMQESVKSKTFPLFQTLGPAAGIGLTGAKAYEQYLKTQNQQNQQDNQNK